MSDDNIDQADTSLSNITLSEHKWATKSINNSFIPMHLNVTKAKSKNQRSMEQYLIK